MMKLVFPALLFLGVIESCGTPQDGGPCTYEVDTVAATVVRIDSNGTDFPEIYITFPVKPSGTDTMRYYTLTNESPKWSDLEAKGLTPGSSLKLQRKYITDGHCAPELFRLVQW